MRLMPLAVRSAILSAAVLLLTAAQAATLNLTGVSVFGGADTSGTLGSGGWNTLGNVAPLGLGISGSTVTLPMDVSADGTYTFTWYGGNSLNDPFANLELFFNGEQTHPGIHVLVNQATGDFTLQLPAGNGQECLAYHCGVTGTNSMTFSAGGETVTILSFSAVHANSAWSGSFSFLVGNPVPEPGTFGLSGLLLVLLPVLRRRKQSRR